MILDVAFRASLLPCGCPVRRCARIIGIDGHQIEGVMRVNSDRAELTVQAWAVDPSLILPPTPGRVGRAITPDGVRALVVEAPFEVHCSNHGRLKT